MKWAEEEGETAQVLKGKKAQPPAPAQSRWGRPKADGSPRRTRWSSEWAPHCQGGQLLAQPGPAEDELIRLGSSLSPATHYTSHHKKVRDSSVVQVLDALHLPVLGPGFDSWSGSIHPTCCGATEPVHPLLSPSYRAHGSCNYRSTHACNQLSEKAEHCSQEQPRISAARESSGEATKTQGGPK